MILQQADIWTQMSSAVENWSLDIFKGQRSCRGDHPVDVQETFGRTLESNSWYSGQFITNESNEVEVKAQFGSLWGFETLLYVLRS